MSKALQEVGIAIRNISIAFGESEKAIKDMVEKELGIRETIEKIKSIKRMAKRFNNKRPQSPYAIFDKLHKKQKRK